MSNRNKNTFFSDASDAGIGSILVIQKKDEGVVSIFILLYILY
ncbi:hypothetical protein [Dysgonomonas termitidis]|uniref:Uncharacterized protein n=1 Tax=Dysgonomonas termitidis TaxID=1516126 RepID=A0ABV9L0L1_9BACT